MSGVSRDVAGGVRESVIDALLRSFAIGVNKREGLRVKNGVKGRAEGFG